MAKFALRNGKTATDRRLGRIPRFDPRSRNFSIRDAVTERSPRSYTWRCRPHLDQGQEGSCVGHGVTHELLARPAEVPGLDHAFARKLYFDAQRIDDWPGGAYPGASPFYEGTSVLSGVKVAQKLGYFDSYRWALSFDDFLLGLSHAGPAVIGVNWWTDMMEPDEDGFLWDSGQIEGGHCLLVKAINLGAKYVTVHNSWGTGWGNGGDAKINFDTMRTLLSNEGEACFFVGRHTKAQP